MTALAFLAFLLAPFPAAAQEEGTVVVGVLADWPPEYTLDEDGHPTGFAVDVMAAVATRAGFPVEYLVYGTFPDLIAALERGEVDMVPNMGVDPSRSGFLFTRTTETFSLALLTRATSAALPGNLGDLAPGTRVGVVQTNLGVNMLDDYPALTPVRYRNVHEALFRLLSGDVEALIYPEPVAIRLAQQAGVAGSLRVAGRLAEVKRAIAISRQREELLLPFDAALADFLGTPQFRKIYARWHAPPSSFWTARRLLWTAAIVLLLTAVAAAMGRYLTLRRLNRELAVREQRFRTLTEGLSEAVLVVDDADHIAYANPRCTPLLGWDVEDLPGRAVNGLAGHKGQEPVQNTWEAEVVRQDGSSFFGEVHTEPYTLADGTPGTMVTINDITARRDREAQVRFQARLLEMVAQAVIATDTEGTVLFWNRSAERLYGWSRIEATGRNIMDLIIPERHQERAMDILEKDIRRGDTWSGEFELLRQDGSTFPALITNAPILGRGGELVGVVGVSEDLTQRRELEDRLRQSQKLEAVGRLAGGVAHDFNNILTAIQAHAELGMTEVPADHEVLAELVGIEDSSRRAANLVAQLLAFSRHQPLHPEALSLPAMVREMKTMLRRTLGEDISLSVDVGGDGAMVWADRTQIEQVILNLAVNARDAMATGGSLTIRVNEETLPDDEGASRDYVTLQVTDDGPGIPHEIQTRIFDPFFTTKEPGKGTGLGLATVHGIVTQSGGTVQVRSEPGHGTEFLIRLPRVMGSPASAEAPVPETPSPVSAQGRAILLVEDEDAVRGVTERILRAAGFTVHAVDGPEVALEALRQPGRKVDLMVSDVVMPGMTGVDLAVAARALRPGMPVLYTSGYSPEDLATRGVDPRDVLAKPFRPHELVAAVQRVLSPTEAS